MITGIDWDKLKVCRVVAEAGSMAAAAAKLKESQATISRKVDEIERVLGTQLFVRSSRGVSLTPAGENALKYMNIMADAADDLHTQVSDLDEVAEGRIEIAATDGLAAHWIAPRLPQFQRQYPDIEIDLQISGDVTRLVDSTSDISIQFEEPSNRDLIQMRLGRLHYMFFASRAYLNVYGAPTSVLDLASHRCIFNTSYVTQDQNWPDKAKAYREIFDASLMTNSGAVMREVCSAGGGIALLPSYFIEVDTRLVPLNLSFTTPIDFWLVYPERTRRLSRGRLLIDWLKSIFDTGETPWFRPTFVMPHYEADKSPHLEAVQEAANS
ncbi:MAG: LysR substrate-binding domain-containing protein [Pseudomonadota bacterium]